MGTDIYVYAEQKIDGKWEYIYEKVPDDRDYIAFSLLASARGEDFEDSLKPKEELPEDMTDEVEGKYKGLENYSYLSLRELKNFKTESKLIPEIIKFLEKHGEETRIIFGFD